MATTIRGSDNFDTAPEGLGKVLQVVPAYYASRTEISGAASNSFADTGLQAVITPTSASSTIVVAVTVNGIAARLGGYHQEPDLRLTRNGNELRVFSDIMKQGGTNFWLPTIGVNNSFTTYYEDSPSSTSAVTYKIQIRGNTNLSGDMRVAINSTGNEYAERFAGGGSSILLMEIAQ